MFPSSETVAKHNVMWTFKKNITLYLDAFPCKVSLPLRATHLFKYGLLASFAGESGQEMSSEELESFFHYGDVYPIVIQDDQKNKLRDPFVILTKMTNKECQSGVVRLMFEAVHYDQHFIQLLTKYANEVE